MKIQKEYVYMVSALILVVFFGVLVFSGDYIQGQFSQAKSVKSSTKSTQSKKKPAVKPNVFYNFGASLRKKQQQEPTNPSCPYGQYLGSDGIIRCNGNPDSGLGPGGLNGDYGECSHFSGDDYLCPIEDNRPRLRNVN